MPITQKQVAEYRSRYKRATAGMSSARTDGLTFRDGKFHYLWNKLGRCASRLQSDVPTDQDTNERPTTDYRPV